jgi:hypothetical protein
LTKRRGYFLAVVIKAGGVRKQSSESKEETEERDRLKSSEVEG